MPRLRVVTVNILNDLYSSTRWEERRGLLAAGLAQLAPDVIALQEVRLPENTAQWLAAQLGGYSVHLAPKTGRLGRHEGVALLSRRPVTGQAVLDLGSQARVAHALDLDVDGLPTTLVNGHFFWWTGHHPARVRQVERLLAWLQPALAERPVVVCGDFNSTPDTPAIALMQRHFVSAHAAAHGREPDYTAPAPLRRPEHRLKRLIVQTMSLFANRTGRPWRGTLDYIFANRRTRVLDCRVVLDQPAAHDPGLYPSDHFGLAAELHLLGADRVS